jgi:hypothetical protein
MRCWTKPRVARTGLVAAAGLAAVFCAASPAAAASLPAHGLAAPPTASVVSLLGGLVGSVIGGVSWTVNLAASFILNLVGGLVKDLIPRSWIHQGLQIMQWLVAVPDYAGKVAAPAGGQVYGFPGVNAMRELYMWIGISMLPLTLLYATSRAWIGQGDHVALPIMRVAGVAAAVTSYTWLWSQAVALANTTTTAIFSVPAVTDGIYKMFALLVTGTALAGLDLVGEILMLVGAIGLLGMIFLKVMIVLVGALVYAVGPLMIGLAPTERGHALARAWMSLAVGLFAIGVIWAGLFAVSAVLINDAGTGAALIGGSGSTGKLLSGIVIAMAAIAGFYVNIKLTKLLVGVVGGQLAGTLAHLGSHGGIRGALSAGRGSGGAVGAPVGGAAASLRGFASKTAGGAAGALAALTPPGRPGVVLAGAAGGAATLARGGLIRAGGGLAARGVAGTASSNVARSVGATRAGAVATRIARGGRDGWNRAAARNAPLAGSASAETGVADAVRNASASSSRRDQPADRQRRTPPPGGRSATGTSQRGNDRGPARRSSTTPSQAPQAGSGRQTAPPAAAPPANSATQKQSTGRPIAPSTPQVSTPSEGGPSPFAQRQPEKPTRSLKTRLPGRGRKP